MYYLQFKISYNRSPINFPVSRFPLHVFVHKIKFIVSEYNFQTPKYLIAEIILYFCA